jgi:hypothetical protein
LITNDYYDFGNGAQQQNHAMSIFSMCWIHSDGVSAVVVLRILGRVGLKTIELVVKPDRCFWCSSYRFELKSAHGYINGGFSPCGDYIPMAVFLML